MRTKEIPYFPTLLQHPVLTFLGANVVFLLIFRLLLQTPMLRYVLRNPDPLDVGYYTDIFSHLFAGGLLNVGVWGLEAILLGYLLRRAWVEEQWGTIIFVIVLVSAIVQLFVALFLPTTPYSDAYLYVGHARRLFETGTYSSAQGHPTAFWPVGYPAFLAVLMKLRSSEFELFARLANIVFFLGFCFAVNTVAKEFLSDKQRIVCMAFIALSANTMLGVNVLMAELPFVVCVWLTIALMRKVSHSWTSIVVSGVLLGFAAYLKPVGALLPLIVIVPMLRTNKETHKFPKAILLLTMFTLTLAPWVCRNYIVFQRFPVLATNGGFNFLMGNRENASGAYDSRFSHDATNPQEAIESDEAYRQGLKNIATHPTKALMRMPFKIVYSYWRADYNVTWSLKKTLQDVPVLLKSFFFYGANGLYYGVIALSMMGIVLDARKGKARITRDFLLMGIAVYSMSIILLFFGSERYVAAFYPVHVFLASKMMVD